MSLSGLGSNVAALVVSVPSNLLIVLVIVLLMKIFRCSAVAMKNVCISYICLCIICGVFGFTVPPLSQVFMTVYNICREIFYTVW